MVRCYSCGVAKSPAEFYPSELKSSRGKCCRGCKREYNRALYARKKAVGIRLPQEALVWCYRCRTHKSTDAFSPSALIRKKSCRACEREYQRAYYARQTQTSVRPQRGQRARWKPHWQPPTERPTMLDLAWAAGFIEGEGSFGQPDRRSTGSGRIYATQKDPEALYRLQRLFGGSVVARHGRMTPFGVSDVYDWTCFGPTAMGLMMTLYSFMTRRRKERIRACLQAIQTRRTAALANRKIWRWENDASGKRRYVDVTHRANFSFATEAGSKSA